MSHMYGQRFDPMKTTLDNNLNERVKAQMQLRENRDRIIEAIERIDRRIAALKAQRDSVEVGSVERRQVEAGIRELNEKRARDQETLYTYSERIEQEEAHLEQLRKIWVRVHNSPEARETYAASEKLPPLWFRLVIMAFWAVAILILVGILPRG